MKQFKDLYITGPVEQLDALVAAVSTNLPDDWHRDPEAEALMAEVDREGKDASFAFSRDAKDGDPKTGLFLIRECGRLYVPNIVPHDDGELSMAQYNRILDEFADVLRAYVPSDSQLTMDVSSEDVTITDWVSDEAAELLQRFSTIANKSTGSSHPRDFERWADFLIQVHRERSTLYSDSLKQWLVEELNWPPDRAGKLARQFEFARDLLQAYDRS
ncbi:MAG: hypothetical protein OXB98_15500 [Bryobacterales bacterium]|nr:hypothetical protein [Bryobacterales bacterium]